jgi:hypothetical protein
MTKFPENQKQFINDSHWIFAKTYAETWPHEYIVMEQVDRKLFAELAGYIDDHGYDANYFDYDGITYWHMDNIINRCPVPETYRRRKAEGRLPEDRS